ncbi:MAG: AMP-binding protein, partial [Oscillospiraceae bacterium]|nr:AMP-binding protein [Oscillospiraceae bacterium]
MLFHALKDEGTTDYILQTTLVLHFEPKEDLLRLAANALSRRYDALRTAILYEGMSKPRQVVLKERLPDYSAFDYSYMTSDEAEAAVSALRRREVSNGFDLQKQPLLRFCQIKLPGNVYKLVWTMHHIIVDGWCMSLLQVDLLRYYELLLEGMALDQLDALIQRERLENTEYSRYVKWLEKQDANRALTYWENRLTGYSDDATVRPFEEPKSSPLQMCCKSDSLRPETVRRLKDLSKNNQITMGTILQTAWGLLLQGYQGSEDIVFGKVVSGRNAPISGIERVIGLFANTVPVRVARQSKQSILELLKLEQKHSLESDQYSHCSLAEIQTRVGVSKLMSTLFAFENYSVSKDYTDKYSCMITQEHSREQTNFDLTLSAYEEGLSLHYELLYDPNRYSERNIQYISSHYQSLLDRIAQFPMEAVDTVSLITTEEQEQILGSFNQTKWNCKKDRTIAQILETWVSLSPHKIALVDGEERFSYDAMNRRINSLAWKLKELGVQRGDLVAILPRRGWRTIVAVCAILKAGAAYVPIDPGYPEQRIRDILEDCDPKAILTYDCRVESEKPTLE